MKAGDTEHGVVESGALSAAAFAPDGSRAPLVQPLSDQPGVSGLSRVLRCRDPICREKIISPMTSSCP
ncbi:hypothetical protein CRV15_32790 (plasmid) [Streptomyces clavuligerus]|uniref:Uncharacterized protein n=1 Tax=Streptomyces clavuligerus TaxID=1901 RepID=B5GME7_STRCL|nr:hypothetical protein D1794_32090 [Streptomyces clavuligerus]EDY47493.1 hypothetical protein SSCG_00521 [Streptomyces clavuligerus]EFG04453.1 Hypothetical protein SCLAV_p0966 [Streptomyces clavuligerus]QCS10335.1 hypothetical protein CRV15_32790 [Streptomyces clavuligerus]QPJ97620.1 hypothetical protein GE265_31680 [Streptomyces clavuligerus]